MSALKFLSTKFYFGADEYLRMLEVKHGEMEAFFRKGIECEAFIYFWGEYWELKFNLKVHESRK
jgi:hypothetical protein